MNQNWILKSKKYRLLKRMDVKKIADEVLKNEFSWDLILSLPMD